MVQAGSPPDAGDVTVCLAELRGVYVVIYFYPRDNTSGCTLEARSFSDAMEAFSRRNTPVLSISSNSVKSHKRFTEKQNLSARTVAGDRRPVAGQGFRCFEREAKARVHQVPLKGDAKGGDDCDRREDEGRKVGARSILLRSFRKRS